MPNDGPLVSVIVPNYNYGASLALCLRAIQEQTYQPLEIVLVDDCSTDDSVAVAAGLGIRAVSTGVNSGVAVARNLGAEHAAGELLVFVDSDVALAPDAVSNAVAVLRNDPSLGAVCGVYEPHPLIRDSLVEEYRSLQQYYLLIESEGPLSTVHTSHFTTRSPSSATWAASTRSCATPRTRTSDCGSSSATVRSASARSAALTTTTTRWPSWCARPTPVPGWRSRCT